MKLLLKNYKGNHLLFLETANNATDQLLTNFKYYGIVEVLRKERKGTTLEKMNLNYYSILKQYFQLKH